MIAVIATLAGGVNGNVRRAAVTCYNFFGKINGQPLSLSGRKFGR